MNNTTTLGHTPEGFTLRTGRCWGSKIQCRRRRRKRRIWVYTRVKV